MSNLGVEIAEKIKKIRKQKGLTMIDLGELSDIGQSTISRIEQGQIPNLETLLSLCNALEISAKDLFDDNIPASLHSWIAAGRKLNEHQRNLLLSVIEEMTHKKRDSH